MAIEFQVTLEDKPGSLAWLGRVLSEGGINIEAMQARSGNGASVAFFVPDNSTATAAALDEAGIPYGSREVVVVQVLDQPGMLADVALVMAEAGINIDCVYLTIKGQVVFGVDDLAGATQVAGGMAVLTKD